MKKSHFFHYPLFLRRLVFMGLTFAACVFLPACFGNKAPERTYFSIDYTLGTQPKNEAPKYDASVVIQNISSALAYDRQEIVYRANPYEFQYYWYRLWASKPRKMLGELISGHLRYTQMFKNVSTTIEDKLPDYSLDVDILSIEELDVSETEWYAHLALRFELIRMVDRTTAWTYTFDAKRPVADNRPVYVVKAMSELLDIELTKAFEDLDKKLAELEPAGNLVAPESGQPSHRPFSGKDRVGNRLDGPRASLKNRPENGNN